MTTVLRPAPPATAQRAPARHSIYWRSTLAVEPGPRLEGPTEADVCIVGGGYTGLWTAHFLRKADPSLRIVVIEADYAGAGASGHNDGFVTPTIGHSLHTVVRAFGVDRAKDAYAAVGRSIMELRRFERKEALDAEFDPAGFFLAATNRGQLRRLEADAALAARLGVSYDILNGAELQEQVGVQVLTHAIKTGGALVNPHRLARGLAEVVRKQDVPLFEGTRALGVQRHGARFEVTTPEGRVRAERVVLATNAYQHQWSSHRRQVMPVWSYAIVTEPLRDDLLAKVHWPQREGFVEACNFIVFARIVSGNRILVGGGPAPYYFGRDMADSRVLNGNVYEMLRSTLGRYFPAWRDVAIDYSYGGCIAMTRDLLPHAGRSADGIYFAHGYCGNGIAMSHTMGKVLRDLVLERETDYSHLPVVGPRHAGFPPDALAYLGARGLSTALHLQDRFPALNRWQLI